MDSDYFFYEQTQIHHFTKRWKKVPEDLPDTVKFAHLNPKVAAFLVNKQKQKQEEDIIGRKSLMPEINQAFNATKNQLDSFLSNDEDSQRYLFEEARQSAEHVLYELSRTIYYYDNLTSILPKSLEEQMMSSYRELTSDVQLVYREWQTQTSKETEAQKDEEWGKVTSNGVEDGSSTRAHSLVSHSDQGSKKRLLSKTVSSLPEISGGGKGNNDPSRPSLKGRENCLSRSSQQSRNEHHKLHDMKDSIVDKSLRLKRSFQNNFMSALTETAMSDTRCWIIQRAKEEELAKGAVLEYCIQKLQQALRAIKDERTKEAEMGLTTTAVVQYYGDMSSMVLKYRKPPFRVLCKRSFKDGKPLIPAMYDDPIEGRQLMLTGYNDGTTVAYYPSGQPAVVMSAAGLGLPGFYTTVYDDDLYMKMLATFTPSGRGVCYHMNGNIRFLSTLKGGHLANKDGKVIRSWKWPQAQEVKFMAPVQFQLNPNISFRCTAEDNMVFLFTCQKECTRFCVSTTPGASAHLAYNSEQLLTAFTFSSQSARELVHQLGPKSKSKSRKKKGQLSKEPAKLVQSVDGVYDVDYDKELARLQRKARNLVDDWLEHYRVTIGLKIPTLVQLTEAPQKSYAGTVSVHATDRKEDIVTMTAIESLVDTECLSSVSLRGALLKSGESGEKEGTPLTATGDNLNLGMELLEMEEWKRKENSQPLTPTMREKLFGLLNTGDKTANKQTKVCQPTERENLTLHSLCPTVLRLQMLCVGQLQCHCSPYGIPNITDVEYERYIGQTAPRNQLQIVVVVSSVSSQINHAELLLNEIYQNQNHNRAWPCLQCRSDMFRILRYDINTAMEESGHSQPLLLTQHNVVPGMCLIYADNRLLFCDHIFNGYGNSRKDFQKQVMKSRLDYINGFSLPRDFRFSPSCGHCGLWSPWGDETDGAGVDSIGSPGTQTMTNCGSRDSHTNSQTPEHNPHIEPVSLRRPTTTA